MSVAMDSGAWNRRYADCELAAGLEIERAETVKRPVQTPAGARAALDALVRARRAGTGAFPQGDRK